MTLAFPNPSRSFDEARNAVRFTGHDGMFEVRFFVDADVLAQSDITLRGTGASERKYLSAFRRIAHVDPGCRTRGIFSRPPQLLHPDCSGFPLRGELRC